MTDIRSIEALKKKILFMVSSMNIGGVEKSLLSLLDNMPRDKYDITILMLNKGGGFLDYIPVDVRVEEAEWFKNVKPVIIKNPYDNLLRYFLRGEFSKIPSYIKAYKKTFKLEDRYIFYSEHVLKDIPYLEQEYDVAISYAGPTEIIDAYISHRVKAKKKAAWVHFDVSNHNINKKLYEKLYEYFDKVFVVSNEAKEKLDEKIPSVKNKSEVMLNVVSTEMIKKLSLEKCDMEFDTNVTNIVTVGRISIEKGQDLAVKALAMLKKDGYKVRWYCVGEGNYKEDIKKLISKYELEKDFILTGAKTNPYPYMKAADIYVQTSRHEGYCLTLAEAKCLNKIIITTDFTGAREQISDGVNGYVVEAEDKKIYEKLKNVLDSEILKRSIKNNDGNKTSLGKILDFIEEENKYGT